MKIIKLCKAESYGSSHYYVMFDEIPEMTYERIGSSYVGSATDENGDIVFSRYLKWEPWGDAFAGRELSLKMKDGTTSIIKDHWFDYGSYKEHGVFISIGAGTLESLQECYVYCSYNINRDTFQKMLDDYYSREKKYEYYEIEKWCKLQYKWHDVYINGVRYPYMVNKKGNFVHRESKEPIYPRRNISIGKYKYKGKTDKLFEMCLFKLEHKDRDRLIKIERKLIDVLKESLPYSEEEIKQNCKIK